jgi:hypothetical protein
LNSLVAFLEACISNYDHFVFTLSFCVVCYYAWFFVFLFSRLFILFFSLFSQDPVRFHYYVESFLLLFPLLLPSLYLLLYFISTILEVFFGFHLCSPSSVPLVLGGPSDSQSDFLLLKDVGNNPSTHPSRRRVPPFSGDCSPSEVPGTLYAELLDSYYKLESTPIEVVESPIASSLTSRDDLAIFESEPFASSKEYRTSSPVLPSSTPVESLEPVSSSLESLDIAVTGTPDGSYSGRTNAELSYYLAPLIGGILRFSTPLTLPIRSFSQVPFPPISPLSTSPTALPALNAINSPHSSLHPRVFSTDLFVYHFAAQQALNIVPPANLTVLLRPIVHSPYFNYYRSVLFYTNDSPIPLSVPPYPAGYPLAFIPSNVLYNTSLITSTFFTDYNYVVSGRNPHPHRFYTDPVFYDHNYFIINLTPTVFCYPSGSGGPFLSTTGRIPMGFPLSSTPVIHPNGFSVYFSQEDAYSYSY